MNSALCKKYFMESVALFVACAGGMFVFCWFRVWIVGELDTSRFRQIIDLLPRDWARFSSVDLDWLVSYLGRTALTLDEPLLIMFMGIWAMVRGSDVVSGELNRGTMEMLLAQPVSRRRVFWTHAALTIAGMLLLALLVWLGMALGIWTTSVEESTYPELRIPLVDYRIPLTFLPPNQETVTMASQVNPIQFAPGVLNLFCLGCFLGGISAFCSSWDRFRWRTLGIVVGFYFLAAMIKILSMASPFFRWTMYLTFFSLYEPESFIESAQSDPGSQWSLFAYDEAGQAVAAGPMICNLLLLSLGVTFYIWGARIFHRRDLPAPL